MLYLPIYGYEDFKDLFGIVKHGNGVESRKNKILLAMYKHPQWRAYARKHNIFDVRSLPRVKKIILQLLQEHLWNTLSRPNRGILVLNDQVFASSLYKTDERNGLTVDNNKENMDRFIRYARLDNGHIYIMNANKMYGHLLKEAGVDEIFPEAILGWFRDEMAESWRAYSAEHRYTLHVDDNFAKIYDSDECYGDFHSCMVDKGREAFYENSVNASAAYLTNGSEEIVARAIVFNEVHDEETEEVFRLCERQYASGGDDALKRILVDKLIEGGYIDGYKKVGVGCGDSRLFVKNNGESLSDRAFYIKCDLEYGSILSYQDSFKWYDIDKHLAYNRDCIGNAIDLATTEETINGEWDSYHVRYCASTITVYTHGRERTCDVDDLDDFTLVNGEYHHNSDVFECEECGDNCLITNTYYSEHTERDYCCRECLEAAERRFCENNSDEYVFIDGEVVEIDDAIKCPVCDTWKKKFYSHTSDITGKDYCCKACQIADEVAFISINPNAGYKICSECCRIVADANVLTKKNGSAICRKCYGCAVRYGIPVELATSED